MLSHLVSALVPRADEDRGATAVEYGLMVTLVVVALVGVLFLVGGDLGDLVGPAEAAAPGGR
jgi:pilus assembly protein Flp/PilA